MYTEAQPLVASGKSSGALVGAAIGASIGAVVLALVVAVDSSVAPTTLYAPATTSVQTAVTPAVMQRGVSSVEVGEPMVAPQATTDDVEGEAYYVQASSNWSVNWAWVACAGVLGAVNGMFLAKRSRPAAPGMDGSNFSASLNFSPSLRYCNGCNLLREVGHPRGGEVYQMQ